MAFPLLPPRGIYPYITITSKTNDCRKLVQICREFFTHLMINFQTLLQAKQCYDSQLLKMSFEVSNIGNKVIIAFVGMYSSISEDALHVITEILDSLAENNFNFSSRLASCVDLNDLKTSDE